MVPDRPEPCVKSVYLRGLLGELYKGHWGALGVLGVHGRCRGIFGVSVVLRCFLYFGFLLKCISINRTKGNITLYLEFII